MCAQESVAFGAKQTTDSNLQGVRGSDELRSETIGFGTPG